MAETDDEAGAGRAARAAEVAAPAPEAVPLPLDGIESVRFGQDGLAPAIVQDLNSGQVLMLGFMTRAMLAKTLETGNVWFWSRSRNQPWQKGETSGNFLRVREVRKNCYDDSLLVLAEPVGPVCHTGEPVCYYRRLDGAHVASVEPARTEASAGTVDWLYEIIRRRRQERPVGSYVVRLLDEGVDRIARKVGEEAAEVIIAAKNRSAAELTDEMADLWFFTLVLLADAGMTPQDVYRELAARHREAPAKSASG